MDNKQTENNKQRKIGFEIEYAEVETDEVAIIIQQLLGGSIEHITDVDINVNNTELGNFNVIIDAELLQELAENKKKFIAQLKPNKFLKNISIWLINLLSAGLKNTAEIVVPYEIITPPILASDIELLEKLCDTLRKKGAAGTSHQLQYAFGLHINPEVKSFDTDYIIRHIQSFLLLEPWLMKKHKANIARRLTPMIALFPSKYKQLLLKKNYNPDLHTLMMDYSKHNNTRNRALDMLPLFAHMNQSMVSELFDNDIKINSRPTFHYRLPNCDISNPEWSIKNEFDIWLQVEKLANNVTLLNEAIDAWREHQSKWFNSDKAWASYINKLIENKF